MFSLGLFVRLFVSRITQNYPTDFHKIRCNGGTRPQKNPLDFGGNPRHVTVGSGKGLQLSEVDLPRQTRQPDCVTDR